MIRKVGISDEFLHQLYWIPVPQLEVLRGECGVRAVEVVRLTSPMGRAREAVDEIKHPPGVVELRVGPGRHLMIRVTFLRTRLKGMDLPLGYAADHRA